MPKKKKINESGHSEIEKKYPSIILGLDISTACIGISIVCDDGVNKPSIAEITHVVPKINDGIKGIEALILRKEIFEKEFLEKHKDIGITECVIEAPLTFTAGNSNADTVAQLLKFNALLSEAVYRVLGIIPYYMTSADARMYSFPQILGIRKYNRKGEKYDAKFIEKSIKGNHVVPFASYPFDIDKKIVMMDLVNEEYPEIEWLYNSKGNLKKENYDACDSLVCALAYINKKKYGEINWEIIDYEKEPIQDEEGVTTEFKIKLKIWDKIYDKIMKV